MIITEIPSAGEREWVQWKGRTARSDRMGQYAVVLAKPVDLTDVQPLSGKANMYEVALTSKLLAAEDSKLSAKLVSQSTHTKTFDQQNALCDDFYAHYRASVRGGSAGAGDWWFPEQRELSRFLGGFPDFAAIAEFRRRHGLPIATP